MMPNLLMTILLLQLLCCGSIHRRENPKSSQSIPANPIAERFPRTIGEIPTPHGYSRLSAQPHSFAAWLRDIPLKADRRVFLFDGSLKSNQSAQFVVLDIPVGNKDLQQCADAIMRLRAQYLFDHNRKSEIQFADNNGKKYSYSAFPGRRFERYLETVFAFCGTSSLEKQLQKTGGIKSMTIGDVLIRGGFPGHAVIVVDMAVNGRGKQVFMLAQSYMPAQDIHILNNPVAEQKSPWYELVDSQSIITPEWTFLASELKKW